MFLRLNFIVLGHEVIESKMNVCRKILNDCRVNVWTRWVSNSMIHKLSPASSFTDIQHRRSSALLWISVITFHKTQSIVLLWLRGTTSSCINIRDRLTFLCPKSVQWKNFSSPAFYDPSCICIRSKHLTYKHNKHKYFGSLPAYEFVLRLPEPSEFDLKVAETR